MGTARYSLQGAASTDGTLTFAVPTAPLPPKGRLKSVVLLFIEGTPTQMFGQAGIQNTKGGAVSTVNQVLVQDYMGTGFAPHWEGDIPLDVDMWPFAAFAGLVAGVTGVAIFTIETPPPSYESPSRSSASIADYGGD